MFFKLTARNPYRDLIRNARRIALASSTAEEKCAAFKELYALLKPKLLENERLLNSQAAFAQRCEHWNARDIVSIKPVTNTKNPWLRFKREFEQAITQDNSHENIIKAITSSLAWFYMDSHKDDWLVD